jgi:ABC-2 type transport system permease protein/oleandomycin transport system permease protein
MSVAAPTQITLGLRARWLWADTQVICWRNLLRFVRIPALFVFSIVQPIMFVLLFVYVFGGVISQLPGIDYVNFLMPGIFVQTAIFGSTQTGIGISEDLSSGILDRFRSLPMARSGVLTGRTIADVVRNVVVVLLMIAVGYLVGFSFNFGLAHAAMAVVLAVLIGFSFSWVSAWIGLSLKDSETVQAASFTWIFPLTFVSSALVPIVGMPSWLQFIARNNPVTVWANAVRWLTNGYIYTPGADHIQLLPPDGATGSQIVVKSLVWIAIILVVFVPLAVQKYRKLT